MLKGTPAATTEHVYLRLMLQYMNIIFFSLFCFYTCIDFSFFALSCNKSERPGVYSVQETQKNTRWEKLEQQTKQQLIFV